MTRAPELPRDAAAASTAPPSGRRPLRRISAGLRRVSAGPRRLYSQLVEPRWRRLRRYIRTLSIAGMIVALVFFLQWNNIQLNRQVIDDVMADVRKIRLEKGLEV